MAKSTGKHIVEEQKSGETAKTGKKRIGLRVLIAVLCVLGLLIGGGVFFINSKLNRMQRVTAAQSTPPAEEIVSTSGNAAKLDLEKLEERESAGEIPTDDIFRDKDIVNILLIGTDMKIPGTKDPGRADAVVICSLNRATGNVKLVGFERTIGMPVPDKEDEILSYIFQYGGGPFMQESVSNVFRVDLTGYVLVPYESFAAAVDAIGGIDVELDVSEVYNIGRNLGNDPIKDTLAPGMNHLNGKATYSYCRLRDADDDWVRQSRVRNALQAVFNKLKGLSFKELNKMADDVLPYIETNLTNSQITSLMLSAPKFANTKVTQLMVPERDKIWYYQTGRGAYMLGCDYTECAKNIREFLYGTAG